MLTLLLPRLTVSVPVPALAPTRSVCAPVSAAPSPSYVHVKQSLSPARARWLRQPRAVSATSLFGETVSDVTELLPRRTTMLSGSTASITVSARLPRQFAVTVTAPSSLGSVRAVPSRFPWSARSVTASLLGM